MPAMSDRDDFLERFFRSQKAELLVKHVLREIESGRNIGEILQDAYVTNRTDELERRALLDHAEISRAVGAEAIARIRSLL